MLPHTLAGGLEHSFKLLTCCTMLYVGVDLVHGLFASVEICIASTACLSLLEYTVQDPLKSTVCYLA